MCVIGIDFDNTLVNYESLVRVLAEEHNLIPGGQQWGKTAIRDHLHSLGRHQDWTRLQGIIYGSRISEAVPYPGALEFFEYCRQQELPLVIVSHKTRFPVIGPRIDLRASARRWLMENGLFTVQGGYFSEDRVYFCDTREAKLEVIRKLQCSVFIDDLPEVFLQPDFPPRTARILFDPAGCHAKNEDYLKVSSWAEIAPLLPSITKEKTV